MPPAPSYKKESDTSFVPVFPRISPLLMRWANLRQWHILHVIIRTVGHSVGHQKESISKSCSSHLSWRSPSKLEHPATKDGIFNFLCQNSLKIDLFQPVSIFDANVKWICSLSGTSNQLLFLPMRRKLWELNYTFTTQYLFTNNTLKCAKIA